MYIELENMGFEVEKQKPIKVYYESDEIGVYYADLIVENLVILELKAVENFADEHTVQLINYLKATEIEVGILLNFGKKPEFRRKIFDNELK